MRGPTRLRSRNSEPKTAYFLMFYSCSAVEVSNHLPTRFISTTKHSIVALPPARSPVRIKWPDGWYRSFSLLNHTLVNITDVGHPQGIKCQHHRGLPTSSYNFSARGTRQQSSRGVKAKRCPTVSYSPPVFKG